MNDQCLETVIEMTKYAAHLDHLSWDLRDIIFDTVEFLSQLSALFEFLAQDCQPTILWDQPVLQEFGNPVRLVLCEQVACAFDVFKRIVLEEVNMWNIRTLSHACTCIGIEGQYISTNMESYFIVF